MLKLMSPVRRKEKQGYGIFLEFDRCRWNATRTNQIVATFLPLLSLPVPGEHPQRPQRLAKACLADRTSCVLREPSVQGRLSSSGTSGVPWWARERGRSSQDLS